MKFGDKSQLLISIMDQIALIVYKIRFFKTRKSQYFIMSLTTIFENKSQQSKAGKIRHSFDTLSIYLLLEQL